MDKCIDFGKISEIKAYEVPVCKVLPMGFNIQHPPKEVAMKTPRPLNVQLGYFQTRGGLEDPILKSIIHWMIQTKARQVRKRPGLQKTQELLAGDPMEQRVFLE